MASKKVNLTIPDLSKLIPKLELTGKWNKAGYTIDNLPPSIKEGYDKAISKFSRKLMSIVKKAIATGNPPEGSGEVWRPLAPSTIKRYGDHPIYNLTGLYHDSIGLFEYKSRTLIGLPIGKKSSQGSLTLNQIAILLEYGSRSSKVEADDNGNIPARPVWGPSLKSMGGAEKLEQQIIKSIQLQVKNDTGVTPMIT